MSKTESCWAVISEVSDCGPEHVNTGEDTKKVTCGDKVVTGKAVRQFRTRRTVITRESPPRAVSCELQEPQMSATDR